MSKKPSPEENKANGSVERLDQLLAEFARLINTMNELLSAKESAEMESLLEKLLSIAGQVSSALKRVQAQVTELDTATNSVPRALKIFQDQYPKDMQEILARLVRIEESQSLLFQELGLDQQTPA